MIGDSLKACLVVVMAGALVAGCASGARNEGEEAPLVARDRAPIAEPRPFDAERSRHTATLLADGTVLIAGGRDTETGRATSAAERYVSSSVGFRRLSALPVARYGHTATRLFDGTVLIAGGFGTNDAALSSAELFLPDSEEFETLEQALTESRGEHTATLLPDGRVLLVGGASRADLETPSRTAEIYDPVERAFHRTTAAPRAPGAQNVAVSLLDGRVFVAWTASGTEEIFDPASGRFSAARAPFELSDTFGSVVGATRLGDGSLAVSGTANFARVGEALACDEGETNCDGQCVDLVNGSTSGECGACGAHCGSEQHCAEGACVCNSPNSYTNCGQECSLLTFDQKHCGSCDHACAEGETCNGYGQCACPFTTCGTACVDLENNALNCGACGRACAPGFGCFRGFCDPCPYGEDRCGASCVNLQTDSANCGACGHACENTAQGACRLGRCEEEGCAYAEQECEPNFACHGIYDDRANCGECDWVCQEGASCQAGVCALPSSDEPTTGATWALTRSSGSLWVTSLSRTKSFGEEDGTAWRVGIPSWYFRDAPTAAYGGPGHTATALPDGSVLVVGGEGTPTSQRIHGRFRSVDIQTTGPRTDGLIQTGLLSNGHLVILTSHQVFEFDGRAAKHVADIVPLENAGQPPLAVVPQPDGQVLLVSGAWRNTPPGAQAYLYDPNTSTIESLDLAVGAGWQALPLPGGAVLIADKSDLALVQRDAQSGELSVENLPVDFRCYPELSQLPNGRVLVVENTTIHELDPRTLVLSDVARPALPRCSASIVVHPSGGALLIGGESPSGRPSPTAELYEPGAETTRTVDPGFNPASSPSHPFHWFDEPLMLPRGALDGTIGRLDWLNTAFEAVETDEMFPDPFAGFSLLPDGSFLTLLDSSRDLLLKRYWVGRPRPTVLFEYSESPALRMNDVIDFEQAFPGHPFPGTAPEGSTGTTTSSPTNLPVAVWFPASGGWPSMGTLTRAGGETSYRVPRTPFPGLGFLFLSTGGALEGVGSLTIEQSPNGNGCSDHGECLSGFCVDGVCCESACEGSCEACSHADKGTGEDGVCGAVKAGIEDDQCEIEPESSCGQNGTCDGHRHCAKYPDGTECGPGDECASGKCVMSPSTPPPGDGGRGGEAGAAGEPNDRCDGEDRLQKADGSDPVDCAPYRCPLGADRCSSPCQSNRDCLGGNVCASGRCQPALDVTKIEGCGCRVPGAPRSGTVTGIGYLAALALLGRRLRRHRPWPARR